MVTVIPADAGGVAEAGQHLGAARGISRGGGEVGQRCGLRLLDRGQHRATDVGGVGAGEPQGAQVQGEQAAG
ncbi:MAG TPA: hypothetical protein VES93_05975, partial [Ornithinibacter sp.]|nr:hypothetical protein [Ornithinibacter sp.]